MNHAEKITGTSTPTWVVVGNPGTDSEEVIGEASSFTEASRLAKRVVGADIMKRVDGILTTEF